MSLASALSLQLPLANSWIHALLSLPAQPRLAVLLVPPLFHEWQRSYRLFALLADELRTRQVAVLRFDYRGCGDSGGGDADFLPSRAIQDAHCALQALQQRSGVPVIALGVRGGGLIASELSRQTGCPLWLWQPVADGARHLADLERREAFELNYRMRYPFLGARRQPSADVLMGQRLHVEFKLELGLLPAPAEPELVLLPAGEPARADCARIDLVEPLADWVTGLDFSGRFPLPPVRALAQALSERAGA